MAAIAAAALAGSSMAGSSGAVAQTTLKAVMHSDVKILDPIWTTAYIVRNHGYMIYDTLFALDEKGEVKPQMVDTFTESPDKLTYTFKLRDGLLWHDEKPVTAEDCVASIKRWSARDPLGQKVMSFVETISATDDKSFTIKLKSPTGLLLFALGKPSSNVPFMMPKRVADTDPNTQISTSPAPARSSSSRTSGSPATRSSTSSSTSTSRAPSRPPASRAARSSSSTGSSGWPSPTTSRPRTRSWPARSTITSSRRTT
jgi:ABC-type transport system substrate-binding protein